MYEKPPNWRGDYWEAWQAGRKAGREEASYGSIIRLVFMRFRDRWQAVKEAMKL